MMPRWMSSGCPCDRTKPAEIGSVSSAAILPLLAGYWAFGQYWGVWVILVFEFQRFHSISDSRLGFALHDSCRSSPCS